MNDSTGKKCIARRNAQKGIDQELALPNNVFSPDYGNYFFFSSDRLFESRFNDVANLLMAAEGSTCCCLLNLQIESKDTSDALFLHRGVTADEYYELIEKGGPQFGWRHRINGFVFASELAQWCIYCERENEIAIVAFQRNVDVERYEDTVSNLVCHTVEDIYANSEGLTYPFNQLSHEWRLGLLKAFGQTK